MMWLFLKMNSRLHSLINRRVHETFVAYFLSFILLLCLGAYRPENIYTLFPQTTLSQPLYRFKIVSTKGCCYYWHSWQKFSYGEGIKVCPDVAACENKHLKVKMGQVCKSCHADTSNNLSSLDILSSSDGCASMRKMVIPRIFAIWMLYDYEVAVMPELYAWTANMWVIFDKCNETVCRGKHRGVLFNYKINCIS